MDMKPKNINTTTAWDEMERWAKRFDNAVEQSKTETGLQSIENWSKDFNEATKQVSSFMTNDHFEELLNYALYDKGIEQPAQNVILEKVEVSMKHKVWITNIDYSTTRISKYDPRLSEEAMHKEFKENKNVMNEGARSFLDTVSVRSCDAFKEFGKLDTPKEYVERHFFDQEKVNVAMKVAEDEMAHAHSEDKRLAKPESIIFLQKRQNLEKAYLQYRKDETLGLKPEKKELLKIFQDYKSHALNKEFRMSFRDHNKKLKMKEVEVEVKPIHTQINSKTGKQYDTFGDGHVIETDLTSPTKEQKIVYEPEEKVEKRRLEEIEKKRETVATKLAMAIKINMAVKKGMGKQL
jgi:hypothetical protein